MLLQTWVQKLIRKWKHFPMARPVRQQQHMRISLEPLEGRSLMAANIFVATTGNDSSGVGSQASPYATLARALTSAVAGDTVTLRGGTYSGGVRINQPNITIQSQPGEWAVVAAPMNDQNLESAIRFNPDASGGRLSRLEITGGYYYGVMLQTTWDWGPTVPKYGASRITIEDCKIHDTGRDCIKLTPLCNDVLIQRNEIFNSGRRDPSNAEGIDDVNANRLIVQDCYIHDIATNGIYPKGGATGCIIQRNVISNCGGGGIMVGFYTDADFFSTDTNPDFYENIDAIVRNNTIVNTQMAGIGLYASLRAQILNNTLVNVAQTAQAAILVNAGEIYFDTNPIPLLVPNKGASLKNNIVVQSAASSRNMFQIRNSGLAGPLDVNNNRYYHTGKSAVFEDDRDGNGFTGNLTQWRTHINGDSQSSEGDPKLDGNQHLAPDSPCIDSGAPLAAITDDIDHNPRTGFIDIGSDERGGQQSTGSVQFSASSYSVGEGDGAAVITVTRSGNTTNAATVRFATSNGNAMAGSDYGISTGTLNFGPGETSKLVRIPITNDSLVENSETFLVTLSGVTGGGTISGQNPTVVTIVDNDLAPTLPVAGFSILNSSGSERNSPQIEVRLSKAFNQKVTVKYSLLAGTATPRMDYTPVIGTITFQPGQTSQKILVPVINDTLRETNETFTVRLSSPVNATLGTGISHNYTILDDDSLRAVNFAIGSSQGMETNSPNLEVRLSEASGKLVTINYAVTGGTATSGVDYKLNPGTLTFQPGETVKFIPIAVLDDTLGESNETIQVTLSSPVNANLGTGFRQLYTIQDNDQFTGGATAHITYRGPNGHVYRSAVQQGATPEDLTVGLNALSAGSNDRSLSISPDGQWMAMETDRFGIGSWTGLALVRSNLSSGEAVRVNGDFVHPEGKIAVASGGNLIVYSAGGGPHTRDLWAIRRSGNTWGTPQLLTSTSPFAFNTEPSISGDGRSVLFDAGNQPYAGPGTAIAEVNTDATGMHLLLTTSNSPQGLPKTGALHSASYAPDGSIVFEADWNGERVWRLRKGETVPVQVGKFTNDNSPVVLPDGRIVSLWLGRTGGNGNHELKVMTADGSNFFMLLTGQDIMDNGLSAGL